MSARNRLPAMRASQLSIAIWAVSSSFARLALHRRQYRHAALYLPERNGRAHGHRSRPNSDRFQAIAQRASCPSHQFAEFQMSFAAFRRERHHPPRGIPARHPVGTAAKSSSRDQQLKWSLPDGIDTFCKMWAATFPMLKEQFNSHATTVIGVTIAGCSSTDLPQGNELPADVNHPVPSTIQSSWTK